MTAVEIILSILGLLGISGILSTILIKKKELEFKKHENKEKRYKSCLLYMDVFFNPKNMKYLSSRQHDIQTSADVLEYLKAEYHEMLLYASKDVIMALKSFIDNPTKENFIETVLAMRKDLWSKRKDILASEVTLGE